MNLIEIKDLYENKENFIDKEIEVGGWVRSIRDSKTFGFIVLNDGTCFKPLQVVYSDKLDNFGEVSKTNIGAALIVKGKLVATPMLSSLLKFRQMKYMWKVKVHRIIHYRRSDTALNTLELFHI